MSLHVLADHMASKGRNGDSMLVHMTPGEVAGLHALAVKHGGQLTTNPDTGLPEANFLKSLLPMLAGVANPQARARALELLTSLDVVHRAKAAPSQLSGGEQQRVSIARALANRPPVILADEPTAPLDSERALGVMRILNAMAKQSNTAIIVVTHDEKIIPTFKRLYHIRDGVTHEEVGEGRPLDA